MVEERQKGNGWEINNRRGKGEDRRAEKSARWVIWRAGSTLGASWRAIRKRFNKFHATADDRPCQRQARAAKNSRPIDRFSSFVVINRPDRLSARTDVAAGLWSEIERVREDGEGGQCVVVGISVDSVFDLLCDRGGLFNLPVDFSPLPDINRKACQPPAREIFLVWILEREKYNNIWDVISMFNNRSKGRKVYY